MELPEGLGAALGDWRIDTLLEKHELFLRWGQLLAEPGRVSALVTLRRG